MLQLPVREKLNIHVIGAGGTGGYFLCFLARLLAGGNHIIHVYDGDRVEPKNLKRQNFTTDELDLNKAEAICNRLSNEILQAPKLIAHSEYLTCKEDLLAEILSSLEEDQSLILVLAVDNIATRKMVNELLMTDLVQERILTIALDSGLGPKLCGQRRKRATGNDGQRAKWRTARTYRNPYIRNP